MRLLLKIGSENEEQKRAKKGCKNHSKSNSFCVYVCCRTQSFKNAINDCILNSSPLFHWFSIIAKIYMHLERFVHLQNWSKCCIRCTFVKKDLHFETNVVIHELSCSPKMFHPLKASFFLDVEVPISWESKVWSSSRCDPLERIEQKVQTFTENNVLKVFIVTWDIILHCSLAGNVCPFTPERSENEPKWNYFSRGLALGRVLLPSGLFAKKCSK